MPPGAHGMVFNVPFDTL